MSGAPERIAPAVLGFFRTQRRDLPWRRTRDPYAIWVSEIMLQQTRVATVIPYFERWLERFPTVQALAEAPLDDVLAAWAGLGYYSRARNLQRGAREVVARYRGALPTTAGELRTLPGIGRYTAGAIASIAFEEPAALVDGNVARVLARLFAIEDDIKASRTQKRLWQLAEELVPTEAPGDFNQGMMELGATVCTPTRPACMLCPLTDHCAARAAGRQDELPVMPARKRAADLPLLASTAGWIERRGKLLLARRRPDGLYGGLWELPALAPEHAADAAAFADLLGCRVDEISAPVAEHRQTLTHRRLHIAVVAVRTRGRITGPGPAASTRYDRLGWQSLDALDQLGISTATASVIANYRENNGWTSTAKRSHSSNRATTRSSPA